MRTLLDMGGPSTLNRSYFPVIRGKKRKGEKRGHNAAKENPYWWPKMFLEHCITVVLALPSEGYRDLFKRFWFWHTVAIAVTTKYV